MNIGIFAKTFVRASLAETLDAVAAHDIDTVQFNLACAGLPSMPDSLSDELIADIRRQMDARGLKMAAISGTFNMIHPDAAQREAGLRRLAVMAAACHRLDTHVITLCTGTRDPKNMWNRHPDNDTPAAWADLLACLTSALQTAEQHDLTLAFEPEVANVIDTAAKGRRLLDEVRSPRLKVVLDAANLFRAGDLARMPAVLQEAFDNLGNDLVLAHAKDLAHDGEAGHQAAGTGVLDYDRYLALLAQHGYTGPLILHSLEEDQVDPAVAFLRGKLAALAARAA
ncbi:MAG: sugar phosphate isomerase/epimerase [Anaerolineales bacterium]|nr:sugar phosphate isomerase/epimerase [Anaerolineales bacterium]